MTCEGYALQEIFASTAVSEMASYRLAVLADVLVTWSASQVPADKIDICVRSHAGSQP